jgi:hypothetical protein
VQDLGAELLIYGVWEYSVLLGNAKAFLKVFEPFDIPTSSVASCCSVSLPVLRVVLKVFIYLLEKYHVVSLLTQK